MLGLDTGYVIRAQRNDDSLYYHQPYKEWTTILHCTKFNTKKQAEKIKDKIFNDFFQKIEVVKCKTEEV